MSDVQNGDGIVATPPQAAPESKQRHPASRFTAGAIDDTIGGAGVIKRELRHIFPDHWSFFLGEIALYSFIILVVTGTLLAFWFRGSAAQVVYTGSYAPLHGVQMSDAYASALEISFDIEGGLIIRQIHHWAALIFAAALVVHLLRTFFTGAYRRPRRLNWLVGAVLLQLVLINGVFGYSLPDDLISGTGLRIAYSITESIPFAGPWLASVMFGGQFPNGVLVSRIYPAHIFLVPALIAGLLGLHLGMLWLQRHTQYPGRGRTQRTVLGTPLIPAYALRTTGYLVIIGGVLAFMGTFLQINPLWLYGPFEPWNGSTMGQPDWYTTWLEGGLRVTPGWDIQIGGFLLPAIFWPAVVMPGILFGLLTLWPWIDAVLKRDRGFHNVLSWPSDRPGRVAFGAAVMAGLIVLLVAGGSDVWAVALSADVRTLIHVFQGQLIALPVVTALLFYVWMQARSGRRRPRAAGDDAAPQVGAAGRRG
jgi:ubiquinol-cytochrome c reductase cytochrome b subunit